MLEKVPPAILIDGSSGEGGGQILRTALTLSVVTRKAIEVINIRSGRTKPGLRPQHLVAVDAAKTVSKAEVEGAVLGADSLYFKPISLRSGRFKFTIGTAGSSSLVLQTIFYPLCMTGSASTVTIIGGTHVPWSPCYHYLEMQWLPYLLQMGYDATLKLLSAGFYPKGGGKIMATIRPVTKITSLNIENRGSLKRISGISAVANLKLSISDRQKRRAITRLQGLEWKDGRPEIGIKRVSLPSQYKGTVLLLLAEFDAGKACFFSLGEIGKPAEQVADEAVDALYRFVKTESTVDQYLADQLLIPLSLSAGTSVISTNKITRHLITNAQVIELFLPVKIEIDGSLDSSGRVRIIPGG